jgi:NitT/TauT family transport system permease protein/sulfonate transport system permease protein
VICRYDEVAWHVIPGALPFIIAGLRVSLSVALVVLVAAELAGAAFGVGYLIQMSQQCSASIRCSSG